MRQWRSVKELNFPGLLDSEQKLSPLRSDWRSKAGTTMLTNKVLKTQAFESILEESLCKCSIAERAQIWTKADVNRVFPSTVHHFAVPVRNTFNKSKREQRLVRSRVIRGSSREVSQVYSVWHYSCSTRPRSCLST